MRTLLASILLLAALPGHASPLCHVIYGGENFEVPVEETADPYRVPSRAIGRYFEFKAVYVPAGQPHAVLSLYVYGMASGEPVLIHQAKFAPPLHDQASHGFTGFQYVYEPSKSSEFQYWCEMR